MKNVLVILIIAVMMSCGSKKKLPIGHSFDYLVGNWERTNGKKGTRTLESWKKMGIDSYTSVSIVIKGIDTIYKETVTLEKQGNDFFYVADVPQNDEPIKFKVIQFDDHEFTATNSHHDFPKKIYYKKLDSVNMVATVSNNQKQIVYLFKKQN